MNQYDVITLGETMLRLTPPNLERFEQTRQFDIEVGGTESNMAVGLARLGLNVAWVSRLPDTALGRIITQTISKYGVDTSHVVWADEEERVGLYFLEEGKAPRGSYVIYDRANSAVSRMEPEELPAHLFTPTGSRLFHLTGITPPIGDAAKRTAHHALELAQAAGWLISFDINFRGKLWSPAEARAGCDAFAKAANLLFVPRGDAQIVYDLDGYTEPEAAITQLGEWYPQATVFMTLGADGAIGRTPDGVVLRQPAFPAEEVGRLGGGDAFAAGAIYGYLSKEGASDEARLNEALRWGTATAAIKYTILGDIPVIEKREVEQLLATNTGSSNVSR
ncbi:MAG: sugar kinase [Chloroflexota bacterium]